MSMRLQDAALCVPSRWREVVDQLMKNHAVFVFPCIIRLRIRCFDLILGKVAEGRLLIKGNLDQVSL